MSTEFEKRYLGDGAYVQFDGFGLKLTTENGLYTTNKIYLEPTVFKALSRYVIDVATQKPEQKGCDEDKSCCKELLDEYEAAEGKDK